MKNSISAKFTLILLCIVMMNSCSNKSHCNSIGCYSFSAFEQKISEEKNNVNTKTQITKQEVCTTP